jgi:hypothetical protein
MGGGAEERACGVRLHFDPENLSIFKHRFRSHQQGLMHFEIQTGRVCAAGVRRRPLPSQQPVVALIATGGVAMIDPVKKKHLCRPSRANTAGHVPGLPSTQSGGQQHFNVPSDYGPAALLA